MSHNTVTDEDKRLEALRSEIDRVDNELLEKLKERAKFVLEIGQIKKEKDAPYYRPEREMAIFKKLEQKEIAPFSKEQIEGIYKDIVSVCRSIEKEIQVAFLGPKGSYAHEALLKHFGKFTKAEPVNTITDIFKEVESGKCEYGVVPIENSYEGVVTRTLDLLFDSSLQICSEYYLRVSHCLLSNEESYAKIKKVYSHPQAIAQCRIWLETNIPHAERIETASTSKAASIVEWDKYSAAISSQTAAEEFGVRIMARAIEDSPENVTRFLIVGKQTLQPSGRDKTSIICTINDKPGALLNILNPFYEKSINLLKIESRPSKKKAWDYVFYIDLEGHSTDNAIKETLNKVSDHCLSLKIVGSYPIGL